MAKLRSVSTAFWSDPFIEELNPAEKLLYIYFITNEKTNMLGIYEVSIKKICFETGLSKEVVLKAFETFKKSGKIKYENNFIILVNFIKHQNYNPNMKKAAIECYNNLPKIMKIKDLKIDNLNHLEAFETLSNHLGIVRKVEYKEEEQEQEEEVLPTKPKKVIKISFEESDLFDKDNFVKHFPTWHREKLRHYYDAALRYSIEGNKYVSWELAIQNWERKDAAKGITYAPIVEEMTQAEINKQKEREFYARL